MTASDQSRAILRDIFQLEKDLTGPDNSCDKDEIQKRIILCCKELIISYPQVSFSKNIDNILWKHCFYRTIEAYRKRIRNLSTILEKPFIRSNATDAQFQEHQHNLLRLSSSLNQFLSQSAAFYESFLMQIELLIGRKVQEKESIQDAHAQPNILLDLDGYLKSIYFCLLYLGDIARYTELHSSSNKQKNWSAASQYYLRSRQVLPHFGNSHNQLAVLCSYKATQSALPANATPGLLNPPNPSIPILSNASIELNAIYHYCRSILVDVPFQTGVENLKLMFEKSAKRFAGARQAQSVSLGYPIAQYQDPRHVYHPFDEYDRRGPPIAQGQIYSQQGYFPGYPQSHPQQAYPDTHHGRKPRHSTPDSNNSNIADFISIFLSVMNEIFVLSLSEISLGTLIQTAQQEHSLKGDDQLSSIRELMNQVAEHGKLQNRVASFVSNTLPSLLDEFESLFTNLTSQLSAEVLLRILTISIFAIHFTRHELKRKFKSLNLNPSNSEVHLLSNFDHQRFFSESYGITCLFSLVSRLALKMSPSGTGTVDKTRRRLLLRVIQFLNIFCDWGRMNPQYLHSVHSSPNPQGLPIPAHSDDQSSNIVSAIEILKASGELLRSENRVRSSLRATVSELKACLTKIFQTHSTPEDGPKFNFHDSIPTDITSQLFGNISLPLPEYIELRGYLPFQSYEIYFRGVSLKTMISISYPSEKESASITRRLQNIEEFIDYSLVPPPPPPVVPPPPHPNSLEIKRRLREERKSKKESRKKEKKSRKQKKESDSRERKKSNKTQPSETSEKTFPKENEYVPNDADFPDIRKYNEVSPPKSKIANNAVYAAALAAIQPTGEYADSSRQRRVSDEENLEESESEDDDDENEDESGNELEDEEYSQGSSHSDLENETSNPEMVDAGKQLTSANLLDDDFDDGDDVIVFKPAFPQFVNNPPPIGPSLTATAAPTATSILQTSENLIESQIVDESEGKRTDLALGGMDLESYDYLRALHQKNTSQDGWMSQPSFQPSLSSEYLEGSSNSNPFQSNSQKSFQFDYWNPSDEERYSSSIFAGLNQGKSVSDPLFFSAPSLDNGLSSPPVGQMNNSAWPQKQPSPYQQFSPSYNVPPPPGFSSEANYEMNPAARTFLPSSLREPSIPNQSQSSPSVLSMLYGEDQGRYPPQQAYRSSRGMNGQYYHS